MNEAYFALFFIGAHGTGMTPKKIMVSLAFYEKKKKRKQGVTGAPLLNKTANNPVACVHITWIHLSYDIVKKKNAVSEYSLSVAPRERKCKTRPDKYM